MPVRTKKISGKYRVVESATGKIAKNASGTAMDGGGFESHAQAVNQVVAVNLAMRRRAGKSAPSKPRK